ncbi:MAG TPA: penicillin-insensitive murein endopeptidase [Acidobacteriota bacterium]|nr:penicillin-insensitive murein endopeptidase [Acidobacteriota bacterium]HQF86766.1 penicillin-insensitive murein endopeptidase [Acidobacteriota bacterium]HQG91436.1 penicillin-insensitive murein endopeptidase [Acidobacteriota bacterium]HQK89343.1 penicillin-insensitive murein endopeptidase [Acidobacteriota bacterium]
MNGWRLVITLLSLLSPAYTLPPALLESTVSTPAAIPEFAFVAQPPTDMVGLSDEQLSWLIAEDTAALGSVSIGFPSGGVLLNGRQMPSSPLWDVVNPDESWGTEETIAFVETAIRAVHAVYPDSHPLYIGDISEDDGGRLNRHQTHQAGRDVDLGFYFKHGQGAWHTHGTSRNLDLPRNWALVRALVVHTDVETVLLDRGIQRLLYDYAVSIGEDRDWLRDVFQVPRGTGQSLVRHVPKHRNHYHVRFYNRRAQEAGIRAYKPLLEQGKIKPPVVYVNHRVRSGQTLGHLARRYGVSVRAIQAANGMRGTMMRAGRSYRIPVRDGVSRLPEAVQVTPRRLPPFTPATLAAVDWTPASHPVSPLGAEALTRLAALNPGKHSPALADPGPSGFPWPDPQVSELLFWYYQEYSQLKAELSM